MIEVDRLTKRFGRLTAVADVTFAAPDGAITGLLGANGAGKTTTLKIISGALAPDGGAVRATGGAGEQDARCRLPEIGSLLDHRGIYSRLTARENLLFFARLRGMSRPGARTEVDRVIDELGLGRIADRRAEGFSEGERMKVALGRALIHRPRNLILDEPTNGLDVPTVRMLRGLLTWAAADGACIVFSSHVLAEVENLCDRIVVMADGKVAGSGTPPELIAATGATSLEEAFVQLTTERNGEELCAA